MLRLCLLRAVACTVMAVGMAVAAPTHARELRLAYDADSVSLDLHEQLSGGTLQLSHMVFDPLVRWTQELGFEPRLATAWERIDAQTMRFTLREGVTLHSGNPMTARDVVWTFDRLKSSPDFKGIFSQWATMTALDERTVELKTEGASPLVLHTATYVFPMDSDFYKGQAEIIKHGNSFASTNVSGTGPFTVESREQGVKVVFKRNPTYWDSDSPGNVTEIVMTPIKEAPTRVAALLAGDVDFIAPVPPTDLERIDSDPDVDLITMTGTQIITLQLNQDRVAAFKDPRCARRSCTRSTTRGSCRRS